MKMRLKLRIYLILVLLQGKAQSLQNIECIIKAFLYSGGGYRAMVGCSGYLHGMNETGILDCVLYMAGKWSVFINIQS